MIRAITMCVWSSIPIKTGPEKGLTNSSVASKLCLAMILIACLLIGACTDRTDSAIRFALQSMPVTLDPRFSTDAAGSRINRLLYQRLVGFDEQFQAKPELADWQQLEDMRYRFILNDMPRQFHHGRQLDANDVAVTYRYILNADNASPHRSSLDMIERIEVIDDKTLDFYLSESDVLFPSRLGIAILPAELITSNHNFRQEPIGSGVFKFVASPSPTQLQLERLADKQRVDFIHVPNPTTRVLKLVNNEIDMMQNDISPELVAYLEGKPGIQVQRHKGSNFTYLGMNFQSARLSSPLVREAIAYAVDRKEIIHYLFQDTAQLANTILVSDHWAGNPDLMDYAYNPIRAKELLKQAGYDKESPLELSYKTSSDPLRIRLATVIQSQLERVGIKIDIRTYDWGTFYGDIKAGRFQLYSLSWVGIKSPDIFRYVFHSDSIPPEGANRGRYINHQVDNLIEAATTEHNIDKQVDYYKEIQEKIHTDLPYIPLWYKDHVLLMRDEIVGFDMTIDGNYDGLKTVRRQ